MSEGGSGNPLYGDSRPPIIEARLTVDERDLIVSALEFASTYAVQPDLAADDLARRLAAATANE